MNTVKLIRDASDQQERAAYDFKKPSRDSEPAPPPSAEEITKTMPGYFQPDPPRPRAPKSSDLVPEDILVGLDYLPTSGARGYVPKDLLYFFVPIVNNQFGTNMWGDEPKVRHSTSWSGCFYSCSA